MKDSEDRASPPANDGVADREKIIAELYEAVLRPEHYDEFMDIWAAHIGSSINDASENTSPETAVEKEIFDPILEEHFNRALEMFERMGRDQSVKPAPDIAQCTDAVLLISPSGRVLDSSPEAQRIFGEHFDLDSLAEQIEPDCERRLRDVLRRASDFPADQLLTVIPVNDTQGGSRHMAAFTQARARRSGNDVILKAMTIPWRDTISATLSAAFRLSPAEIEVVRLMSDGHVLSEIAVLRKTSLHTVRAQTKAILRKTKTAGQSELMRFVAMLSHASDPGPGEASPVDTITPHSEMLTLPDGREMEIQTQGPEDGLPVIFIHGMLDGTSVTRKIRSLLNQNKIRLICPVRAGFGRSTINQDHVRALDIFSDDLQFVLQTYGIDRPVLLGHMSGSLYAWAAASARPAAFAGVVNVSGGVPITSIRQFSAMSPRQRVVAYTARFTPALLPGILRAGISQIDGKDSDAFMKALYREGTRDREIVEEMHLGSLIQSGYRFAVQQGYYGFEMDSWHVTRDWSARVADTNFPVVLVHGTHDPVVEIGSVRRFAQKYSNVELREHPDAGQLVFYQKPQTVIDAVKDVLSKSRQGALEMAG